MLLIIIFYFVLILAGKPEWVWMVYKNIVGKIFKIERILFVSFENSDKITIIQIGQYKTAVQNAALDRNIARNPTLENMWSSNMNL